MQSNRAGHSEVNHPPSRIKYSHPSISDQNLAQKSLEASKNPNSDDSFFSKEENEKRNRSHTSVYRSVIGMIVVGAFVVSSFVAYFSILEENHHSIQDNKLVRIEMTSTQCIYTRSCEPLCDPLPAMEHKLGCCTGCRLQSDKTGRDCSIPVKVKWEDVKKENAPQRVWIFASADCEIYYQTGYAPYVEGDSMLASGTDTVNNTCLSNGFQQMVVVACLSEEDLQDKKARDFPSKHCRSYWGKCIATNDVFQKDLSCCTNGTWNGNS